MDSTTDGEVVLLTVLRNGSTRDHVVVNCGGELMRQWWFVRWLIVGCWWLMAMISDGCDS